MGERIPGILRYVDLVCRYLQSAVVHARAERQVQPLAGAFIDGPARSSPHWRLGLHSGLLKRLLQQHHMAIEHSRPNLRGAAGIPGGANGSSGIR